MTSFKGVDTFEGLFKITEELSHHKFNIQDFVNIADPGPPRRHTESLLKNTMDSLNKDFSTDLLILASVSICIYIINLYE